MSTFRDHFHINLKVVDFSQQFLTELTGVTDPQRKRRIIGAEFINAFKSAAFEIANVKYLAQGTLYPDVIESGSKDGGPARLCSLWVSERLRRHGVGKGNHVEQRNVQHDTRDGGHPSHWVETSSL